MEVEFFRVADILNYSRLDIRVKRVERPFNGSFCYPARGTTNRRSRISLSLFIPLSITRELEARHPLREPPT